MKTKFLLICLLGSAFIGNVSAQATAQGLPYRNGRVVASERITLGNLGVYPLFDAIDNPIAQLNSKVYFIQQLSPDWIKNGGDAALLQSMVAKIPQYASAGKFAEANQAADDVLALLGAKDVPVPDATEQLHRAQRDSFLATTKTFTLSGIEDYIGWVAVEKDRGIPKWDLYRADAAAIQNAGYSFVPFLWIQTLPAWVKTDPKYVFAGNVATGLETEALSIFAPETLAAYDHFFGDAQWQIGGYADILRIGSPYGYGETTYPALGNSSFLLKNVQPGFWVNEAPARAHFKDWMRSKYASVQDLNTAWGTTFPDFDSLDYPKDNTQPRYWLDFVSWYHQAFTERMGKIVDLAQQHFPQTPINFNLGYPYEKITLGQDLTGLVKMAAGKHNIYVRTPTGASVPFLYTKRVATAARLYGPASFSSEPVNGNATYDQMALAYFKDLTTGVKWHFDYGPNYDNCRQSLADYRTIWMDGEYPRVNTALFFPTTAHYLDDWDSWRGEGFSGGFPEGLQQYAEDLRDMIDYDVVDERLVSDGFLDAYTFLIWPTGKVAESATLQKVTTWVKNGGTLLIADIKSIHTVEGAGAFEDLLTSPVSDGIWEAGKGRVLEISGDKSPLPVYAGKEQESDLYVRPEPVSIKGYDGSAMEPFPRQVQSRSRQAVLLPSASTRTATAS